MSEPTLETRVEALAQTGADGLVKLREALAAWMIGAGFATGHGDTHAALLAELTWQVEEIRADKAALEQRAAELESQLIAQRILTDHWTEEAADKAALVEALRRAGRHLRELAAKLGADQYEIDEATAYIRAALATVAPTTDRDKS